MQFCVGTSLCSCSDSSSWKVPQSTPSTSSRSVSEEVFFSPVYRLFSASVLVDVEAQGGGDAGSLTPGRSATLAPRPLTHVEKHMGQVIRPHHHHHHTHTPFFYLFFFFFFFLFFQK